MAKPQFVEPVKLLAAILWSDLTVVQTAVAQLQERWGTIDFSGQDRPFDVTEYYQEEMGVDIRRRLVSFSRLIAPEGIVAAKLSCNEIEEELSNNQQRRVNLDVGYLDHSKFVLASCKFAGQKIHLGRGVYADLMGRYQAGRYRPFEWTFPDLRDGRYDSELNQIRLTYLRQLRSGKTGL